MRASHGVSVSHRAHGSVGQCQEPGRVFKNKRMAGHMGAKQRTAHNLEVIEVFAEEGLILVKGGVPTSKGQFVLIKDAVKKLSQENLPMPAGLLATGKVEVKKEVAHEFAEPKADKIVTSEAQAIEDIIVETAEASQQEQNKVEEGK
jgi:large subunit ribosomal protein L3